MMMVNRLMKMSLLRHGVSEEKPSYKIVLDLIRTRTTTRKMTTNMRQSMDCTEHVGLSGVVRIHKRHERGDGYSCL